MRSVKTYFPTSYITGNTVTNKWKYLKDNFCAELNKMNANKFGDRVLTPSKSECQWRWFSFFFKAPRMLETKNNMQFVVDFL
jgi:hypothetical protein